MAVPAGNAVTGPRARRRGRSAASCAFPWPSQDRRIFTPTPHGSPSWKRGYRRRPALERIYSRLDNDFGFERHFLRGHSRVRARVSLALTVMMALALAQARAGHRERMRSLVDAIPFADTG